MTSTPRTTPVTGLDEFRAALFDYKSISSWAMDGSVVVPLLDHVTRLGPPWPWAGTVPIITSIAELLTLICVFHFWSRSGRERTNRKLVVLIVLLLISFGAYLYVNSAYTFSSPVDDEKRVKGFVVRDDVKRVITSDFAVDDALQGAEFRPEEVWTSSSITAMRLTLLFLWLLSFVSLSTAIGTFVLYQRRRRVTNR